MRAFHLGYAVLNKLRVLTKAKQLLVAMTKLDAQFLCHCESDTSKDNILVLE